MNEFRKEDGCIIINVPYAEAYIPTSLFTDSKSSVAYFHGDAIRALGMFYMRFFKSDENVDRENTALRTFKYPNMIETRPTSYHKETLSFNGAEEEEVYVLQYYYDDIMCDARSEKHVLNCEAFMDALNKAKLPKSIGYEDVYFSWMKNFKINGIHPGTKAIIPQIIVAENTRYAKDETKPYRMYAAFAKELKPDDCVMVNMNAITANNSVLSGIGFERVKEKIATSVTMSMKNVEQNISPLEKVIIM